MLLMWQFLLHSQQCSVFILSSVKLGGDLFIVRWPSVLNVRARIYNTPSPEFAFYFCLLSDRMPVPVATRSKAQVWATRLLTSWLRILLGAWMCCLLSSWGLCDELITRPEEWWRRLGDTQRQDRELISGTCLGVKGRLLSFSRIQSRAVRGLLTGHNTLRRHFYLVGLSDTPLCRRCVAGDETAAHILGECEALASLKTCVSGLLLPGGRGH